MLAIEGNILTSNSTSTPLAASSTFTGQWVDVSAYESIVLAVSTDQDGTYQIQFSPDGTNIDSTLSRNFDTNKIIPPERLTIGRKFARITFTNTSVSSQTYLRLQTLVGSKAQLSFPTDRTLPQRAEAIAIRNDYYSLDVGLGRREGAVNWRKFGFNTDIDTVAEETIWAPGGRWTRLTSAETLDVSSSSANDTNSSGTGARQLRITGVGDGYVYQTETVNLNGTSTVVTSNTWLGVNRVEVISVGSTGYNEGNITLAATTAATTQAYLPLNESTTQQALFFCPTDRKIGFDMLLANFTKISGGGSPRVTLNAYVYDHDTGIRVRVLRLTIDTAVENTVTIRPANPFVISGGQVIEFSATTDVNNTEVNLNFWGTEVEDA